MLVGERLVQEYDGVTILKDVNVSVVPGAVTALIGKSGSGKSTLLRTLCLVDPPTEGTISLAGQQIFPFAGNSGTPRHPWPAITLVFQQFFLWPHFDVRRNIVFPATLRGKKIEKLDNICDALGIGDLLDRYPRQISVGQRQRVALARALVLGPRYLLLDEITSAQDVQHVALILDALHETARRGTGVLVVSHHFGFVRRLLSTSSECQVVFLENGAVVESGGIEHLESPHSDGLREYTTLARTLD